MTSTTQQYRLQPQRPFERQQRDQVTILCGGLTFAHERLVQAGLRSLGYNSETLPNPSVETYTLGREHCSNGLCNPAYFTIGNLLDHLKRLREQQGLSAQEICERYVFYTAGSYGPCRFGMYESEYRLALASAGFKDFRVLIFQQSDGLVQTGPANGLDLNPLFFMVHLKAFLLGDIVNELYHQLRPFEIEPGAAARARLAVIEDLAPAMRPPKADPLRTLIDVVADWPQITSERAAYGLRWTQVLLLIADQFFGDEPAATLRRAMRHFDAVEVDRLQVKPVVKITGEFWAQTTESDGNFKIFEVLERDGVEILAEPIATWMDYLLHLSRERLRNSVGLPSPTARGRLARRLSRLGGHATVPLYRSFLRLVSGLVRREYDRLRAAAHDAPLALVDQQELMELAEPYYDPRLSGGEGHLEIGKTLHYTIDRLAHMVVSLKPFGCMPSTQSDGAQPKVLADYPEVLYLPVETSADGETMALSRVQMMLAEARARARKEWRRVLDETGRSVEELRAYLQQHPELSRGVLALPHGEGWTSTAARLSVWLDQRMRAEGWTFEANSQTVAPQTVTPEPASWKASTAEAQASAQMGGAA